MCAPENGRTQGKVPTAGRFTLCRGRCKRYLLNRAHGGWSLQSKLKKFKVIILEKGKPPKERDPFLWGLSIKSWELIKVACPTVGCGNFDDFALTVA